MFTLYEIYPEGLFSLISSMMRGSNQQFQILKSSYHIVLRCYCLSAVHFLCIVAYQPVFPPHLLSILILISPRITIVISSGKKVQSTLYELKYAFSVHYFSMAARPLQLLLSKSLICTLHSFPSGVWPCVRKHNEHSSEC